MSPDASPWSCDEERGPSYNQRTWMRMESDEALGQFATISAVLYANINHPEWRTDYPSMFIHKYLQQCYFCIMFITTHVYYYLINQFPFYQVV